MSEADRGHSEEIRRLGLVAGNGPLPLLVLEEATTAGVAVTVAAIKEETEPEVDDWVRRPGCDVSVHWIGLGQLGKLLKAFKSEGVSQAVMVGQVKHVRIFAPGSKSPFSQIKHLPDWQMIRFLSSLKKRDTGSLIGGIIDFLEEEGIRFIDSTVYLQRLLAEKGCMTGRELTEQEDADIAYGHPVAREIARLDLGQTIVVKDQAVVAVEAMEGTDATIRRAAELVQGERLTVVKVSRPNQEMRYDVPVTGMRTLEVLRECNVSALAIDAGKTLMIDKEELLREASASGIAIVGV